MWYFQSEDGKVFYLRGDKTDIALGRSSDQCDWVLLEDSSISRKHAIISESNGAVTIMDLCSRYGTYLNQGIEDKTELEKNTLKKINENDRIRFGILGNVWQLHKADFITCTSTVKGENLSELKEVLQKIKGTLLNEFDDSCKYLTMPEITLTIKVVQALVQGANIVTVDFWKKCCNSIQQNSALPDAKDYLPQVIEATLDRNSVSFHPNIERKELFTGKKVIFFSRRQMELYKWVLQRSSATVTLLSECKMTKAKLCSNEVIVIQYIPSSNTQESQSQLSQVKVIEGYLENKLKRVIRDVEIGLAILYNSLEKYCNPKFSFPLQMLNRNTDETLKTSKILAPETQDVSITSPRRDAKIIEESLVSVNQDDLTNQSLQVKEEIIDPDTSIRSKRKLSSGDQKNSRKKANIEKNADMFDFVESATATTSNSESKLSFLNKSKEINTEKELGFLKNRKRKPDNLEPEDDIFNFVPDKKPNNGEPSNTVSKRLGLFNETTGQSKQIEQTREPPQKKLCLKAGISAIKDEKVKDLTDSIVNMSIWRSCEDEMTKEENKIKAEQPIDVVEIGRTLVTFRSDLIVKSETSVTIEGNNTTGIVNFKKFKKVWPLKMHITVLPVSSMSRSIIRPDESVMQQLGTGMPESSDEEEMMIVSRKATVQKKKPVATRSQRAK